MSAPNAVSSSEMTPVPSSKREKFSWVNEGSKASISSKVKFRMCSNSSWAHWVAMTVCFILAKMLKPYIKVLRTATKTTVNTKIVIKTSIRVKPSFLPLFLNIILFPRCPHHSCFAFWPLTSRTFIEQTETGRLLNYNFFI